MQKIRWFFLISIIVLALVLAIQNSTAVEVQLLFTQQTLPLSLLLMSTLAVGFLLGALMTASMLRKRKGKKAGSKAAATPTPTPKREESNPLTDSAT